MAGPDYPGAPQLLHSAFDKAGVGFRELTRAASDGIDVSREVREQGGVGRCSQS